MPPASSFYDCGSGQSSILCDEGSQRRKSFLTVDINDDDPGDGAGRNSDVGVWPFAPPLLDLSSVRGRNLKTAFHTRMFAGLLAAIVAARASAIANRVQRKDAPAVTCIRQRPIEV